MHGVQQVWPGCLIQWEDFKGPNALRILDHFRDRGPQLQRRRPGHRRGHAGRPLRSCPGTGPQPGRSAVRAGRLGRGRHRHRAPAASRPGRRGREPRPRPRSTIALLDSHGLVHAGRADLDEFKRDVAMPSEAVSRLGLKLGRDDQSRLVDVIRAMTPGRPHRHHGAVWLIRRARHPGPRGRRRTPGRLRHVQPVKLRRSAPGGHPRLERWPGARRHRQPLCPGPLGGPDADRGPGQQRLHLPRRGPRGRGGRGEHPSRSRCSWWQPGRWRPR